MECATYFLRRWPCLSFGALAVRYRRHGPVVFGLLKENLLTYDVHIPQVLEEQAQHR